MIADFEMVEREVNRVLTQYRESPKLLHMIRTYLRHLEAIAQRIEVIPDAFHLNTAVGDQLTIIGKRMGWPRCHCVCKTQPVFGFECYGVTSPYQIAGFCEENSDWIDCAPSGYSELCINDDELYRKFLKVRAYQVDRRVDIDALESAVQIFWGDTARVLFTDFRTVVVAPGRDLTVAERNVLQLYPRVLPIAVGTVVRFHFDPMTRVFGFGDGWGGFCDDVWPDGTTLGDEYGNQITDSNWTSFLVEGVQRDSPWMCMEDVRPYDCA
ncbi:hypothetical protein CSC94_12785 [Zhengella mangrovi]|uniref:Uncharacterized protein n=1 Tax=Zhengella mangrovi TaxID=1982044 RepID=A0A2G1QM63_9HYPH|nr:DUF2612 domain-containing protein [Zhengella mangrovi]PHP66559.1 hypothetical protein CSC94_12785 [Zhengella mangrovi]